MISAIAAVGFTAILFVLFLFVARRILRLAVKLAAVAAIVCALFIGGIVGWWRGWFSNSNTHGAARQTNSRTTSNSRSR